MYEYIQGTLVTKTPHMTVIDANGIGFKLLTPVNLLQRLPHTGEHVLLYVSFVVREQSQTLFGFSSKEDRDFFDRLTNISGIGPKTALSLVGHLDTVDFSSCSQLCKIPGIGKKTAERLLLELRGDLPAFVTASSKMQDAVSALVHLGYTQSVAEKAIRSLGGIQETCDLSHIITEALKNCV